MECVCQWNVFSGAEKHQRLEKVGQQMKYFRRRCLPPTQNFKDNMKGRMIVNKFEMTSWLR